MRNFCQNINSWIGYFANLSLKDATKQYLAIFLFIIYIYIYIYIYMYYIHDHSCVMCMTCVITLCTI